MKISDINNPQEAFVIDEYGRIIIKDKDLLEMVSGANFDQFISSDGCNNGCGSNGACYNSGCKR